MSTGSRKDHAAYEPRPADILLPPTTHIDLSWLLAGTVQVRSNA
jgi:hypothetical protein